MRLLNFLLQSNWFIHFINCGKEPIYVENGIIKCLDSPIGTELFVNEVQRNVQVVDRDLLIEILRRNAACNFSMYFKYY